MLVTFNMTQIPDNLSFRPDWGLDLSYKFFAMLNLS